MAQTVAPGHLEAVKTHKILAGHSFGGFVTLLPFGGQAAAILGKDTAAFPVKGIGVVGNRQKI